MESVGENGVEKEAEDVVNEESEEPVENADAGTEQVDPEALGDNLLDRIGMDYRKSVPNEVFDAPNSVPAQDQDEPQDTLLDRVLTDSSKPVTADAKDAAPSSHQGTFSYTIEAFSEQDGKVYSPDHRFGGFRWRFLIFPKGNNIRQSTTGDIGDFVSVYLDCRGPDEPAEEASLASKAWSQSTSFKIIVVSALGDDYNWEKECSHRFAEADNDWGFREFVQWSLLSDPGKGYMVDDSITFRVEITLQDDQYDSRKNTGFAGLKNQGATCYMNSLLQTLYTLGTFRRGVYEMPLPEDYNSNNITYALQRVFYDLQKGQGVIKTKKLTKSFGWDTAEAFTQHDVQELNRLLTNHLEETLKKADKANKQHYIAELFEGKTCKYIECINVPYKSVNEETFLDLSLQVKGCRDIYESLDKFTEVQMLEGDNKYRTEGYEELQEAKMGERFVKLPPVLQLHLRRIDFDMFREVAFKINDRFEFGVEIDLSKYVENSDGRDVYVLHSVLVHSGDVNGGHYYAFIRPDPDMGKWYKFDDEVVTEAKEVEAVDDNYGFGGEPTEGNDNMLPTSMRRESNMRRCTSAYWLQYIRNDSRQKILKPVHDEDIPTELEDRLRRENEEEERRKKERAEQHLYMSVAVATENDLEKHVGPDLVDWHGVEKIRLKKAMPLSEMRSLLLSKMSVGGEDKLRLWRMVSRADRTVRPDARPLEGEAETRAISRLLDMYGEEHRYTPTYFSSVEPQLRLFAELVPKGTEPELGPDDVLLFIKNYEYLPTPNLSFLTKMVVSANSKIADLAAPIADLVPSMTDGNVSADDLLFFEERSSTDVKVPELEREVTLARTDARKGGGILIVQKPFLSSEAGQNGEDSSVVVPGARPLPTVTDYFSYLKYRVTIQFRNRFTPNERVVELELLLKDSYLTVRRHLAAALGGDADEDRLRISDSPLGEPFGHSDSNTLEDMLHSADLPFKSRDLPTLQAKPGVKTLYYEKTDYPIAEFDEKDEIRVTWSPYGGALVNESKAVADPQKPWEAVAFISALLQPDAKYQDVIDKVYEKLHPPYDKAHIRLVFLQSKTTIARVVNPDESVFEQDPPMLVNGLELRAEPIHEEDLERERERQCTVVQVVHVPKSRAHRGYHRHSCFGSPFLIAIATEGEKVADLRERLRERMQVGKEEMESWRLAEMSTVNFSFLEDREQIWIPESGVSLAVEHTNPDMVQIRDKPLSIGS